MIKQISKNLSVESKFGEGIILEGQTCTLDGYSVENILVRMKIPPAELVALVEFIEDALDKREI